jgi:hypothetical protein
MNKYFYIVRWDKGEPYLDSFYKLEIDANTKEEQLLHEALDPSAAHDLYRDAQAVQGMEYRARANGTEMKCVICEEELTREEWEEFLKIEHEHNPESRWLK